MSEDSLLPLASNIPIPPPDPTGQEAEEGASFSGNAHYVEGVTFLVMRTAKRKPKDLLQVHQPALRT